MPDYNPHWHRATFRYPAPVGTAFGPQAFAHQIGRILTISIENGFSRTGILSGAEVVDDGAAVMLTLDIDAVPTPDADR